MAHPRLSLDGRLVALAAAILLLLPVSPPLFRGAVVALAIVALVLAALPKGTRGVVSATMVGLATGIASVNLFAVGIFQGPITAEFGWTQTQYSLVTVVGTVVTVLSSPFIGRLFDRQGVRRWALTSIVLFALALMSLYWLSPHPWHFYAVFALVPIIGAGTSSVAYSRVVAAWFDERRGQAFGAALAGIGIGGAVLSAVTQYLIGAVGWRGAYLGLGVLTLLVTLPIVFWKLRDTPAEAGLAPDGLPLRGVEAPGSAAAAVPGAAPGAAPVAAPSAAAPALVGYSAAESRRQPRFWSMLVAFLLLAVAIGGVLIPLVPILRARGIPAEQAAATQATLGLALIFGRAFAGFLMDRFFAPRVAALILAFPVIGVLLLADGGGGTTLALVAAACIGLAAGAELDVIAVLITRYFGNRAYAENYGWQYAAWTLGSGFSVLVTNGVYDAFGSHAPALWGYAALFVLSGLLILRLGRYPVLPTAAAGATRNL
ncbi:MAG: MFS transporter [Gammaproteobacteria bacterium]|nr:MFS transporter [Gammaproteobacteria bacterium]